jgi:hypothetical protein
MEKQRIRTNLNARQSGFQKAMHSHPLGQLSYIGDGAVEFHPVKTSINVAQSGRAESVNDAI